MSNKTKGKLVTISFLVIFLGIAGVLNLSLSTLGVITTNHNSELLATSSLVPDSSSLETGGITYGEAQPALTINETATLENQTTFSIGNGSVPNYNTKYSSMYLDSSQNWTGTQYTANISFR
jgi:hypothetical protein